MLRTAMIVVFVLCLPALLWGQSDEKKVKSLVRQGLEAYEAGNGQRAVKLLQEAIGEIEKDLKKNLASFLPAAPEGWKCSEVKTDSLSFGSGGEHTQWVHVSREYWMKEGGPRVTITITNSPQLMQVQEASAAAFRNPQMVKMMNQDPNTQIEVIDEKPWFGYRVVEKEGNASGHAFCKSCMVTIEVPDGNEATLKRFWKIVNFKGLAGVSTGKGKETGER